MRGKVIFSPQLAQYLLHCGFTIIELKPKHGAPNETVFVFKYEKGLDAQIATWLTDEA
jgi:hypothetical protein